MKFIQLFFLFECLLLMVPFRVFGAANEVTPNFVDGSLVRLNDNGAWSWFMDERVVVDRGQLIVGSVRSLGAFQEHQEDPDWGNIEIASYDLSTGETRSVVLHPHLEQDDHDGPALHVLPDGRYLAVYSKHAVERKVYYRFSEPGDPMKWGEAHVFETPGDDQRYGGNNVTYANLFQMPSGRIYNFHRSFSHDPNYMYSDDQGNTWTYGGRFLKGRDGYSPYLKYAFDGKEKIHFIATEDHPRNYDNSIYHGYLQGSSICFSDGTVAGTLSQSTDVSLATWDLTRVFQGDADNVAWTIDIELDDRFHPYIVFSVQKDGRGLPPRQGGMDHRFHYGRWDGEVWKTYEIAYAGTRLYPFEDDYTGLAALHPNTPNVIFISTDAHPETGQALVSRSDGKRHRELFKGTTTDQGKTWQWHALTRDSTMDNLRPLVPKWNDARTALVWMRGHYRHNHGDWDTSVVALILPER